MTIRGVLEEHEHIDLYNCENDSDHCTDDGLSEDEHHKTLPLDPMFDYDCNTPITEYAVLKIGITTLVVSSDGKIRKMDDVFSSSIGYALPGTPYRTYTVEVSKNEYEEYYVHDLVWRAFNGEPPAGWEVRHNYWEAKDTAGFYSNALENLELYVSTVTYMPSVRTTLPDPIAT